MNLLLRRAFRFPYIFSARRLDVVVLQAASEASRQGAADDNDPGCHAVLPPVKDVPYEDGSGQRGQEAGPNVQVAGPGQAGVRSNAVEGHKPNDQNETWKEKKNRRGLQMNDGLAISWIFNSVRAQS